MYRGKFGVVGVLEKVRGWLKGVVELDTWGFEDFRGKFIFYLR